MRMTLSPQTLRGGRTEEDWRQDGSQQVCLPGLLELLFLSRIPTGGMLGMELCGWGIVFTAWASSQLPPSEEGHRSAWTIHTGSLCGLQGGTKKKLLFHSLRVSPQPPWFSGCIPLLLSMGDGNFYLRETLWDHRS